MAHDSNFSVPSASRRSFLGLSAAASAALALRIVTEPMLASAKMQFPKDGVRINANENPLGPGAAAREAAAAIVPQGGRYSDWLTEDLVTSARRHGRVEGRASARLSGIERAAALHRSRIRFAAAQLCHRRSGIRSGHVRRPGGGGKNDQGSTDEEYAHDVRSMLAAGPDAGVFYVCTPNNPTGTLTSHSDIEYLVENKPRNSVVLVDEAYIHFSDAPSVMDLVKAGKDVILLRTFSKIYGMAGLRCGAVFARPDLIEKIESVGGWNFMPITAVAAASASLKDPQLVPERKRLNAAIRNQVFAWLDRNGYSYIPSESNCFMLDTKKPAKAAIDAMAKQKVYIGRIWPVVAHLRAHYDWDSAGDGGVPGGVPEGDDGSGDGQRGWSSPPGRVGAAQEESGCIKV
jgi:histidinol-phosphate aminotransferase